MKGRPVSEVWTRSSEHPARRFGDEWLILEPARAQVFVIRGAPALAAFELLSVPRDLGDVIARVEAAVHAPVAASLVALFDELRAGQRLVATTSPAVPVEAVARIPLEPVSFFTDGIASLFSGLSGPSHSGSASFTQNGNGVPCGR